MQSNSNEINRIKAAYDKRKGSVPADLYSFFDNPNIYSIQSRDRAILHTLKKHGITDLGNRKILDIGCGTGSELRNFIRYGADPHNLYGIDLLDYRIEIASYLSPNIHFESADASSLPYDDRKFDLIVQFTVFTSILDMDMKKSIAGEMLRVLKPEGIIIWHDYYMDNPKNSDVKGVRRREIDLLFTGCHIDLKRITLAPPLARIIAPYSILVCDLIEKLRILNTHFIGTIRKTRT